MSSTEKAQLKREAKRASDYKHHGEHRAQVRPATEEEQQQATSTSATIPVTTEGDAEIRDADIHDGAAISAASNASATNKKKKRVRVPRRVLHFSDGVIEEYSTDEEEAERKRDEGRRKSEWLNVDPKTLRWVPWMVRYTWIGGAKFVSACDAVGEKIAWFLGITSPKYYYEIEEYKRQRIEDERRKKREDEEMRGWRATGLLQQQSEGPIELEQGVNK